MNKILTLFFLTVFSVSFFSCESQTSPRVCTDILEIVNLTVLTSEDEPVILNQLTITNLETGRTLDICDSMGSNCESEKPIGTPENGNYVIFHDGLRDEIPGDETDILVEGSNEAVSFQQEFEIGDDGCHVFKKAGPDTIYVELE